MASSSTDHADRVYESAIRFQQQLPSTPSSGAAFNRLSAGQVPPPPGNAAGLDLDGGGRLSVLVAHDSLPPVRIEAEIRFGAYPSRD